MLQIQHLRRTESHFHKYVAQNPSARILYTNACAKLPTNSPHANIWTYIFDFEHYIRIMCPLYSPSTSDTCLSSSGLSTNISAIRKYSEVQGHANPSETYMTSVCADFGTILMCVLIHIYMISLMKKRLLIFYQPFYTADYRFRQYSHVHADWKCGNGGLNCLNV